MAKVALVSPKGIQLIEQFECSGNVENYLKAYKCPAGVWTIGFGTTIYPNGKKVKEGDVCTREQAYHYLRNDLIYTEDQVDALTIDSINQNQFDSLISFAYNIGIGALRSSMLLRKVNSNPNDPSIRNEFIKWIFEDALRLPELVARRNAEADLYFSI
ncbi:MAG: lysozyme [Bacteroidales bacterium]|nr:lysozyme [Bacteroidales bacterium]